MAKRKQIVQTKNETRVSQEANEPEPTRAAFNISLWVIVAGFIAQVVMAIKAYPLLPKQIPSSWVGSTVPYMSVPSWVVFVVFPGAQIILLLLAIFSPKDDIGRRVMESGKAWALVLLALLFTALQLSAFHIPSQLAW